MVEQEPVAVAAGGFNRTFMELKWCVNNKDMTTTRFNRTFMELK